MFDGRGCAFSRLTTIVSVQEYSDRPIPALTMIGGVPYDSRHLDSTAPADAGMNRQAVFLSNLETIERIIASICRRHLLLGDDQEDFASYVKLRLVDDDYAAIAKFQGRSSISTYLTVVVTNCFRDFRTNRWGRWRPSAEAKRLGPLALRLEILLYRDGHGLRQAIEVLRSAGGELPSDAELIRLASRLPSRTRTYVVGPEVADGAVAQESADAGILQDELDRDRTSAAQEVERALQSLPPEDQLILRMRYLDGISVADIARLLGLEQKPLYRRIDNGLRQLRGLLEQRGVSRDLVATLLTE